MADIANFTADPLYTGCDQITTVGARVRNSRRAFRAQSQLMWAVQWAGKAYRQRHSKHRHDSGHSPDDVPWQRLQSAYGRIRVPIPESHDARSRVAWLEAGETADLIYIGGEDLNTRALGSKFVVTFSEVPSAVEDLPLVVVLPDQTWWSAVRPAAALAGFAGREHRSPGGPGESDVDQPVQRV